jgi:limonene-1,2-epoxide hydrolase
VCGCKEHGSRESLACSRPPVTLTLGTRTNRLFPLNVNTPPEAVVREFWRLMESNDFNSVSRVLASEFVMDWPQSKERIRGAENFVSINSEYPTNGQWKFRINRLVTQGNTVVTQVSLTDGIQAAEPISFFTVEHGKITHLVEYWPDPFEPNSNRRHLVERMS